MPVGAEVDNLSREGPGLGGPGIRDRRRRRGFQEGLAGPGH
jgi:hypothetical protein